MARYQGIFNIVIYTFAVLGNHMHLLLHAPNGKLDEFMENVLREIARRVNRVNRRRGNFWSRRYDDQVILSDEDLLEAYLYVTTNAVKHGLVKDVAQWPGLNCYPQLTDERPVRYPFVHYSQEDESGKAIISHAELKLSPLPQHARLSRAKRVKTVRELVSQRQAELVAERKEKGAGFLGAQALKAQPSGRRPVTVSRSPRPPCYTKDATFRKEYRANRSVFREQYCEASERFRSGDLQTMFPSYCFKPPLHRIPRKKWAA